MSSGRSSPSNVEWKGELGGENLVSAKSGNEEEEEKVESFFDPIASDVTPIDSHSTMMKEPAPSDPHMASTKPSFPEDETLWEGKEADERNSQKQFHDSALSPLTPSAKNDTKTLDSTQLHQEDGARKSAKSEDKTGVTISRESDPAEGGTVDNLQESLLEAASDRSHHRSSHPKKKRHSTRTAKAVGITSPLMKSARSHHSKSHRDDEGDEESEEDPFLSSLAENSFSFILAAKYFSTPFFTAVFTFVLKSTIYILIGTNLLQPDPQNPVGFPASVTAPVLISQFCALLIAVATQDDVVDGLNLIYEGYSKDDFREAFPAASLFKWLLVVVGLLLNGILGLVVTFLLIMTSSTVVDLLLNFTAVEFVALLDNAAFLLARLGFIGISNKTTADLVSDTEFHVARNHNKSPVVQMWMLILTYLTLVGFWGIVFTLQLNGQFTVGGIVVQFDDDLDIGLASFSGKYTLKSLRTNFGFQRIRYWADIGPGMFGYCASEQAWTFSESRDADPCGEYIARSSDSSDFDISTTNQDSWFASENARRYFPMENFQILKGCEQDDDCGSDGLGTCNRNRCECAPGFYGWRCDHSKIDTCGAIEADDVLTEPFTGTQTYFQNYEILKKADGDLVLVYGRPVYISPVTKAGKGDVIFYFGLRWGLFPLPPGLLQSVNVTDPTEVVNYFSTRPDVSMFLNSSEFFVSDVVTFNTPSDGPDPTGLAWQLVRKDGDLLSFLPVNTVMICAVCSSMNPCANENVCPADGRCNCTNGATGTLCRRTPLSNGFCDTGYFNDFLFDYDGGDCCERTCVSTGNNTCGVLAISDDEYVRVGYPHCQDSDSLCTPIIPGGQCWTGKSMAIQPLSAIADASMFVSPNGRIIVEVSPRTERVRVLDQVDSRWLARGNDIGDARGSRFGSVVAIYTPPGDVTSIGRDGVDVVLAVGLYRLDQPVLRVFFWDEVTESWANAGGDISLSGTPSIIRSMGVGRSGDTVIVGVSLDDGSLSCYVGSQSGVATFTRIGSVSGGSFAMSGNGRTLAVVSPNTNTTVDIYEIDALNSTRPLALVHSGDLIDGNVTSTILSMALSYDGRFLSAVLLSDNGGDDQALRVDVSSTFPTSRSARDRIGPLSRNTLQAGFVPLQLNGDGESFAITVDTPEGLMLKVYHYFARVGRFHQVGEDYSDVFVDSLFGVSSRGSMLAVGQEGTIRVSRLYPDCHDGEASYRLSINLGSFTAGVSWRLRSFRVIGNNTFYTGRVNETCVECYDNDVALGQANVNVGGCRDESDCLLLEYWDSSGNESTYFQLFDNETLSVRNVATREPISSRVCGVERSPCQGGDLVTMAISFDDDAYWYVRDEKGSTLFGGRGNATTSLLSPSTVDYVCVPEGVGCLSFTIEHNSEEGRCCEFGEGFYGLFYNSSEVVQRNSSEFGFGERVTFGRCPTTITPSDHISIVIQPGAEADGLMWYVEDETGKRLGSWSSSATSEATNITSSLDFFLGDTNGCLVFVVEDSGRDGFFGNNTGYKILLNDEVVVERDGNFGFAERTSFGKADCPAETVRSELITAVVQVGDRPLDTGWYIGSKLGVEIDGIVLPSVAQTPTETTLSYDPIAVNDAERCHTFTIMDRMGDGGGGYELRVGWEAPIVRNGTYGYGERVRFGSGCEVEVFGGFQATLNLTMDDAPNETSWSMSTVDGVVLPSLPLIENMSSGSVRQDYFHFPESSGDGCVYFVIEDAGGNGICCNGDTGRPLVGQDGQFELFVDGVTAYRSDGRVVFGERVQFGRECGVVVDRATRFTVTVNFDGRAEDVMWYIGDDTGRTVIGGVHSGSPNEIQSTSSASVFDPVDVQSDVCYSLTIVDRSGDGLCCTNGFGNYTVGVGLSTIAARGGDFGYGERLLFGLRCSRQLEVMGGFAVTANVGLEHRQNETAWSLQDTSGHTLYSSVSGGVYSSSADSAMATAMAGNASATVFHFPQTGDAKDECIWFTIEDEAGRDLDPFVLDNSYSLSVNGQLVLQNPNGIGYGERVQFGIGGCVLDVVKATTVRIDLSSGFDVGVGAVGDGFDWYIGNSSGGLVAGRSVDVNQTTELTFTPESVGSVDFCHTFTILNSNGTGNGGYSAYLGWKAVFVRDGRFGFAERLRFGQTCPSPPIAIQGYQAMVGITFDGRPNETTWRIEDSMGEVLVSGAGDLSNTTDSLVSSNSTLGVVNGTVNATGDGVAEDARTRSTETLYYFPESASEECLVFFIDDVGGDGICCPDVMLGVNQTTNATVFLDDRDNVTMLPTQEVVQGFGSYQLFLDGSAVFSSAGRFGAGERVQFGGGNCSLSVNAVVLLRVEIGLDSRPAETGWRLSELSSNREIASVPPGFYSGIFNSSMNTTNPVTIVGRNQTSGTFGTVTVEHTVRGYEDEAYMIVVEDAGGDGLCCSYGRGYFRVFLEKRSDDVVLIVDGNGMFESMAREDFNASMPVEVPANASDTTGGSN